MTKIISKDPLSFVMNFENKYSATTNTAFSALVVLFKGKFTEKT